jgi:hypothetical protein
VSIQPFSNSHVRQGKAATYAIWIWSTGADAHGVTVSANVRHIANVSAARFTVCPQASGALCTVGDLPTGQSDELLASVNVARSAAPGAKVTLTATVHGSSAASFNATATVLITSAPPRASGQPSPTQPASTLPALPGSMTSLPGSVTSLPGSVTSLPGSVTSLPGLGTSPQNPGTLFPKVSPGTSAKPSSPATGHATGRPSRISAVTASATLPLDPRLIGGQLAGLAVLASAIAIAIARLSLRAPRPQNSKTTGQ